MFTNFLFLETEKLKNIFRFRSNFFKFFRNRKFFKISSELKKNRQTWQHWRDLSFSLFTVLDVFSLSRVCFAIFPIDKNIEQRICLKFCIANGISCAESLKMLEKAYSESTLSNRRAYEWYSGFKSSRDVVQDLPRSVRPSTSLTEVNIAKVKGMVTENRHLSIHLIWLRSTFFFFQNSNYHFQASVFSR